MNLSIQSLKKESKLDLIIALREPAFIIPTLSFPFMFYIFFGLLFSNENFNASYYMVTYSVFGIMGSSLFGFGANIAMDRDRGWLAIKQVSPINPLQIILAKLSSAIIFSSIIMLGIFSLAIIFAQVRLNVSQWVSLMIILILGTIPFCALGLAVGFWVKGNAAIAIVNLIYLPMSLISGLWIPITVFPDWLQNFSQIMPPYHLSQLALNVIDYGLNQAQFGHFLVLFSSTILFLFLASIGYRKTIGE